MTQHSDLKDQLPAEVVRPMQTAADGLLEAERRIERAFKNNIPHLNISNLGLTHLPESLWRLANLQSLEAGFNQLTEMPELIGQLTQLRALLISCNKLTAIPESVGKLTRLRSLLISSNELTTLPKSICQLDQLQVLSVSGNRIITLPESLGRLIGLWHLDADSNQLKALPESLGQLTQLRTLSVRNNQIKSLPKSLRNLSSLREIFLHGNAALGLSPEVLGAQWKPSDDKALSPSPNSILNYINNLPGSPAAILDYYFLTLRARRPLNEAKLILVGRGGVGKTCLLNRLVHDSFNEHEPETPGIEIQPWPVMVPDGDLVRLHVWDFGGQEILHATHQFFLTERTLYLLVLSGREGNPTQDAEYWLQLIRSFGGDSRVIIVLNKSGQHPFDLNRGLLLEKYSFIADFIKTECSTANGLTALRQLIFKQIGTLEHRKANFPADWFEIKERLAEMQENFITWDQYQQICHRFGEHDTAAQRHLAGFLHTLGIALNYREDPRLQDTHVLNPRWVTEGIYTLLRAGQREKSTGVLTDHDLGDVLDAKHYPPECHSFLLRLMEKFQLCFRLPGRLERYLVPELLGENQPDLKSLLEKPGLDFRYQYEVLPEGLLPRFIVQTHAHSEANSNWRWRTGVVLQRDGCEAIVRADARERRVDIHITGDEGQRRGLLAIIREKFDEQHSDLKGLTVDERVPVPGASNITVGYRHLMTLEGNHEEWCWPDGAREKLRVVDLLNGVESFENRERHRIAQSSVKFLNREGMMFESKDSAGVADVTIGIITALPKEYVAIKTALLDCQNWNVAGQGAGRRYVLGRIPSVHGGEHRVALAMADMGNNIASARAALLLEHFSSIETIIMVGIAGGVPALKSDDHVRLGDIVVSNKHGVIQYDMIKLTEIRACPIPPSAKLIEAVQLLEAEALTGSRPWEKHIEAIIQKLNQKRPISKTDILYSAVNPEKEIAHPKDSKRLIGQPRVFFGAIASANELLKDPVKRDALRDKFKIKAVEMEGSGIADATWLHEKGYLVVRGVCDYCDTHKNDIWQEYAAAAAAGYTVALVESLFVPTLTS